MLIRPLKLVAFFAVIGAVAVPSAARAQLATAPPSPGPAGSADLVRPKSVDEYGRAIAEAAAASTAPADREHASARLRLLMQWRAEDVSMNSPPALGIGIGLGAIGTASSVVALSFVARGGGGFDGGYFNYRAVGYAMLIPSAVLLGAATALIVVGARPTMKAPMAARGGAPLGLSMSLGGISGVF